MLKEVEMEEIREKIEYMLHKNPDKVAEFVKQVYHRDPEIVEQMLEYPQDAEHIAKLINEKLDYLYKLCTEKDMKPKKEKAVKDDE